MEINAASASAMRLAYVQQQVEVAAMAKSNDMMEQQGQAAVALIEAAGQVMPSAPLPGARQGQNINILA